MALSTYFVIWVVLTAVVGGLALYRKYVSMHEDNYVHLSEGEARLRPLQVSIFRKLATLDRWGKILTALVAISGAFLLALYLYRIWPEH